MFQIFKTGVGLTITAVALSILMVESAWASPPPLPVTGNAVLGLAALGVIGGVWLVRRKRKRD